MRRRLLIVLGLAAVIVVLLAYGVQLATRPAPTPTPYRHISFEEALASVRNPPKPIERWSDFKEYRWMNDYKQPSYKAADGSIGHYLYHASDGTLYEAIYPSGEIGVPIALVIVPSDEEAYYIWEIIAYKKQSFVDARSGEVLYVLPAMPNLTLPPIKIEFDINSSYGFDRTYPEERHFIMSRGRSATLPIILTSTADRALHLTLNVTELPAGVTAEFDSEFVALEPNKPVTVKLIINVSSTAPTSTMSWVHSTFTLEEDIYRFKMMPLESFQLTIV